MKLFDKPKNYDPRFDTFANVNINDLAGKKQNVSKRIQKSRILAERVNSQLEKELEDQALDFINEACINQLANSRGDEKKTEETARTNGSKA